MKYRIIEEVNGNDERHFDVEFWKKGLFGWKWKPVQSYRDEYTRTRHFSTREEATEYIKAFKITRNIVEEGDTDVD